MKNYKFSKKKIYKRIDAMQKYLFDILPDEYNSQPLSIRQALEFVFNYIEKDNGYFGKNNKSLMGNMKVWFVFGYERWGGLRPAYCCSGDGKYLKPLFWGIWIRCKKPSEPRKASQS